MSIMKITLTRSSTTWIYETRCGIKHTISKFPVTAKKYEQTLLELSLS